MALPLLLATLLQQPLAPAPSQQRLEPQVLQAAANLGIHLPSSVPTDLLTQTRPQAVPPPQAQMAPWPTVDWSVSTPQAEGMDAQGIRDGFQYAIGQGSQALLVARHGYVVAEWYAPGWAMDDQEDGFSMAKSVTSALYGAALQEGLFLTPRQKVSATLPAWNDAAHRDVEMRHLLSMDSGLHWDFFTDYIFLGLANDQSQFALNLGMDATPGTTWVYNNSACQVLSALFEGQTGHQIGEYFRLRLANVIGMHQATWMEDQVGNTLTYRSVFASAREFAKFGYLFLRDGQWDGTQVVPTSWSKPPRDRHRC